MWTENALKRWGKDLRKGRHYQKEKEKKKGKGREGFDHIVGWLLAALINLTFYKNYGCKRLE